MLNWLRGCGKFGETLAWILALIETKLTLGAILSLLAGTLTIFWTASFDFFANPHTQIFIGVFLASLWTYIGIRLLRKPVKVTVEPEYKYCLSPEGFALGLNPEDTEAALQVLFNFRNVGNFPLRLQVEKFQLIIEDRTCPEPENKIDLMIPRFSARAIRSGTFKKDVLKPKNTGTLNVSIIYGAPDGAFVRRYHFKTKLHFAFPQDAMGNIIAAAIVEELTHEEDGAI